MLFQDILNKNQEASDAVLDAKAKAEAEAKAKAKAKAEAEANHLGAWLDKNHDTVLDAMKLEIAEFLRENGLRPAEVSIVEVPSWELYNCWDFYGGYQIKVEYLDIDGTHYPYMGAEWGADLHEFYFTHEATIKVKGFLRVGEGYEVVLSDFPKSRADSLSTWEHRSEH